MSVDEDRDIGGVDKSEDEIYTVNDHTEIETVGELFIRFFKNHPAASDITNTTTTTTVENQNQLINELCELINNYLKENQKNPTQGVFERYYLLMKACEVYFSNHSNPAARILELALIKQVLGPLARNELNKDLTRDQIELLNPIIGRIHAARNAAKAKAPKQVSFFGSRSNQNQTVNNAVSQPKAAPSMVASVIATDNPTPQKTSPKKKGIFSQIKNFFTSANRNIAFLNNNTCYLSLKDDKSRKYFLTGMVKLLKKSKVNHLIIAKLPNNIERNMFIEILNNANITVHERAKDCNKIEKFTANERNKRMITNIYEYSISKDKSNLNEFSTTFEKKNDLIQPAATTKKSSSHQKPR